MKVSERNKRYARLRSDWMHNKTNSKEGFRNSPPSKWMCFTRAYTAAGGDYDYTVMKWVEYIAERLMNLGMSPESTGILLAWKQRNSDEWKHLVLSGGFDQPKTSYEIEGVFSITANKGIIGCCD